jgi:hypothetical protein
VSFGTISDASARIHEVPLTGKTFLTTIGTPPKMVEGDHGRRVSETLTRWVHVVAKVPKFQSQAWT